MTIIPDRVTLNLCDVSWCTDPHRFGTDIDQYGNDLLSHSREIGTFTTASGHTGAVWIAVTDAYDVDGDGRLVRVSRTAPTIFVSGADDLNPDQARQVAVLLTEASIVAQRIGSGR